MCWNSGQPLNSKPTRDSSPLSSFTPLLSLTWHSRSKEVNEHFPSSSSQQRRSARCCSRAAKQYNLINPKSWKLIFELSSSRWTALDQSWIWCSLGCLFLPDGKLCSQLVLISWASAASPAPPHPTHDTHLMCLDWRVGTYMPKHGHQHVSVPTPNTIFTMTSSPSH